MEMSKTILGREPTTRTVQWKATHGEDQQGAPRPRCSEWNPASWGVTAETWAPRLCCHLSLFRIKSAGCKGEVWGLGFLRPTLLCLLSLVLSQRFLRRQLWKMRWLCPSRAGTDKLFAPSEAQWNTTFCNSLPVACYLMFMNVQDMENVVFTPSLPNTAVATAVFFHTAIALSEINYQTHFIWARRGPDQKRWQVFKLKSQN